MQEVGSCELRAARCGTALLLSPVTSGPARGTVCVPASSLWTLAGVHLRGTKSFGMRSFASRHVAVPVPVPVPVLSPSLSLSHDSPPALGIGMMKPRASKNPSPQHRDRIPEHHSATDCSGVFHHHQVATDPYLPSSPRRRAKLSAKRCEARRNIDRALLLGRKAGSSWCGDSKYTGMACVCNMHILQTRGGQDALNSE